MLFTRRRRSAKRNNSSTNRRRAPKPRRAIGVELLEDRQLLTTLTVNSLGDISPLDDNFVTLREAIAAANNDSTTGLGDTGSGADTIVFAPGLFAQGPATIEAQFPADTDFGPSAYLINSDITIVGPTSADGITIERGSLSSAMNLRLFRVTPAGALTLENLTLHNGRAVGGDGGNGGSGGGGGGAGLGGAVFNQGSLTILASALTGNEAVGGNGGNGGFSGSGGAGGDPNGGANTQDGGFGGGGGGGDRSDSTGAIFDAGNGGFGGGGGGVAGLGQPGVSGIGAGDGGPGSGSAAGGGGGGAGLGGAIFNDGGQVVLTNVTASVNSARGGSGGVGAGSAPAGADGAGLGGAVFNRTGTLNISNSTIAANIADAGGGINGPATLVSTILADNGGGNVTGNITSAGHNLSTDDAAGLSQPSDLNNTAADLGPLQNNGGPTSTHELLPGSPALDAGSNPLGLQLDQRGVVREQGPIDIGAFERRLVPEMVYVDDNFANPVLGQDPDGPGPATSFGVDAFATIQEGVTFVAVGGTVNINPGFYPEEVNLARDITLDGTGAAGDVVIGMGRTADGITITGGNVIVRDLTVDDARTGIRQLSSGGDLTLRNVQLLNNFSRGIETQATRAFDFTDVTAFGNLFEGAWLHDVASFSDVDGDYSENGTGVRLTDDLFRTTSATVTFTQTRAEDNGTGIFVEFFSDGRAGSVTFTQTTAAGNGFTGVVVDSADSVMIDSSTFSNNQGGGLQISAVNLDPDRRDPGASVEIINSTISGNTTRFMGGGILFDGDVLEVSNSTITNNRSDQNAEGFGLGGGIAVERNNSSSTAPVLLSSSIVAGNVRGPVGADTPDDLLGAFDPASDFNLIGIGNGSTGIVDGSNENQVGTSASPIDPLLGPLANNGGPTATHAPLANSPAINVGDPAAVAGMGNTPEFDQRGAPFTRVLNGRIDIGAFEVQNQATNHDPIADPQNVSTAEDTALSITLTGADGDPGVVQTLTFAIDSGPANGTLSGFNSATGEVAYTPNADYNGPDSFTFTVTDDDTAGGPALTSLPATVDINVAAVNDTPTAGPANVSTPEDTALSITLTGADGDPGVVQTLTFAIDSGPANGTLSGFNSATGEVTYTPNADYNGPDSITFTVTDDNTAGGTALTSLPATVEINVAAVNSNPTIPVDTDSTANEVLEGANAGTLAGITANSTDIDSPTVSYHLSNDAGGRFAIDSNSGIVRVADGSLLDGPATHTITVEASDGAGGVSTANFDIAVNNVAPSITQLASSHPDVDNKSADGDVTISGAFSDPAGSLDTHTFTIDFGDGSPLQTLPASAIDQGADTFTVDHTYTTGGIITVTVTVRDKDGGVSASEMTTVVITGVGLNNGVLQIIGTDGSDKVFVSKHGDQIRVRTRLHGQPWRTFSFHPSDVQSIQIVACDGNDHVVVGNDLDRPSLIRGGNGHDLIFAGAGNDVVLGEAGSDWIFGGSGRDLLIGGTGRDRIFGFGGGGDVLIHGTTDQDANDAALRVVLTKWTSADSYETGATNVEALISVQEDNDIDDLFGNSGRDLFFAGLNDKVNYAADELVL